MFIKTVSVGVYMFFPTFEQVMCTVWC